MDLAIFGLLALFLLICGIRYGSAQFIEAGSVMANGNYVTYTFRYAFTSPPIVIVTPYGNHRYNTRITDVSVSSFKVRLDSMNASAISTHRVNFVAFPSDADQHMMGTFTFETFQYTGLNRNYVFPAAFQEGIVLAGVQTSNNVNINSLYARGQQQNTGGSSPKVYATVGTSVGIEGGGTSVLTLNETVGIVVIDKYTNGLLNASTTLHPNIPVEIGRTTQTINHAGTTILFQSAFSTPPIVIAFLFTKNGGDAAQAHVTSVTSSSVEVSVQEGHGHDGVHTYEILHYLAFPSGVAFFNNPTSQPTSQPSRTPSSQPLTQPTQQPTSQPSRQPTSKPSNRPSPVPTKYPSSQPTTFPSNIPTLQPSQQPLSTPSTQPSQQPTSQPSEQPLGKPSYSPTTQPSRQPSHKRTSLPSIPPTGQPSCAPSNQPSKYPTTRPTSKPSCQPSHQPSLKPSLKPSSQPSSQPLSVPSSQPSLQPTSQPTFEPTCVPTCEPTQQPTVQPSSSPSSQPSSRPSIPPTGQPSSVPSNQPSKYPTTRPTSKPSCQPSHTPSSQPSLQPTVVPSSQPTLQPTSRPTSHPSGEPSSQPSIYPTTRPTSQPSHTPSSQSSSLPTSVPSRLPSLQPTSQPTCEPTCVPTCEPTQQPTVQPSSSPSSQPLPLPSIQPTGQPSSVPSNQPSKYPTTRPTTQPSHKPSHTPSSQPSLQPTVVPSSQPSLQPFSRPTSQPSCVPSNQPSIYPTSPPTSQPSHTPSSQPSSLPTFVPSRLPSLQPTSQPTSHPSCEPSNQPSKYPTTRPTTQPSHKPSSQPSSRPSIQPSSSPSYQPSLQPTVQPSNMPSIGPTLNPSSQPTVHPTLGSISDAQLSLTDLITHLNTSGNMSNFFSGVISVRDNLISSTVPIISTLLSSPVFRSSVTTMTEVITSEVGIAVAWVRFSNNSYDSSTNSMIMSPLLSIPGSQSTLSLAQSSLSDASGKGNVLLSVVALSQSMFSTSSTVFVTNLTNANTDGDSTLQPVLSSDVISIQVLSTNGSTLNRPISFIANMTVSDELYSGSKPNMEFFQHECELGRKETVLFPCLLSQVTMNLTCTGLAAAAVKRSCPVPQRVCSVLSLSSLSVTSDDYCQAQVTGNGVLCKCGYARIDDASRNDSIATNVLDGSGAVNMAVMTRFVSGGLSGNVYTRTSADDLVTRSTMIFVTFGTLLFGGLMLLGGVLWHMDNKKSNMLINASMQVVPDVTSASSAQTEFQLLLSRYLWSTIPICFYAHVPWPKRLDEIIKRNHLYFRVFTGLVSICTNQLPEVKYKSGLIHKKLVLDIVQIITTFVTSCAILALVFDLQYPSDDGSCAAHTTEILCLLRKTPLDASQTYCVWDAYVPPSAGVLSETYINSNGQLEVLQEVTLEAALASSTDTIHCSYNSSSKSVSATVLALVITSLCALPITLLLTFVMTVIRSHPIQDLQHRHSLFKRQKVSFLSSKTSVVQNRKRSNTNQWQQICSYMKQKLIVWFDNTQIVQIPELPNTVKVARTSLLKSGSSEMARNDIEEAYPFHVHLHDQSLPIHESLDAGKVILRPAQSPTCRESNCTSTSSDINDEWNNNGQVRQIPQGYVSRWNHMKRTLQYLTDAEFAMVLLHTWLPEIPSPSTEDDWLRNATNGQLMDLIRAHIQLQFPAEAYTTDILRIFCMVLIAVMNLGSIYFIAARGAVRGYGWQVQFLSVCLLNWISETWFLRVWDILVLDFYLPSWVAKDVSRKVQVMIRTYIAMMSSHGVQVAFPASNSHHLNSHAEFQGFRHNCDDVYLLSRELAACRYSLLESQVVNYYASHMIHQASVSQEMKVESATMLKPSKQNNDGISDQQHSLSIKIPKSSNDTMNGSRKDKENNVGARKDVNVQPLVWVRWMLHLDYSQQCVVTQMMSSGLLVCVVYVWYAIRQRRETQTTAGFLLAVIFCVVLYVLWLGHRAMQAQHSAINVDHCDELYINVNKDVYIDNHNQNRIFAFYEEEESNASDMSDGGDTWSFASSSSSSFCLDELFDEPSFTADNETEDDDSLSLSLSADEDDIVFEENSSMGTHTNLDANPYIYCT